MFLHIAKKRRCGYNFFMRILGLDVGNKRIGVALSDPGGLIAQPCLVITRRGLDADVAEVLKAATLNDVEKIVVGLPYSLDGTLGPQGEKVLKFIEALKKATSLDIETWDERFSTAAVERTLIEGDVSRADRKGVVDKVAAAFILQGYLDSKGPRE